MDIKYQSRWLFRGLAGSVFLTFSPITIPAPLTLSQSPLFLATSADPNVFFALDDSGSMDWEILTRPHDYYMNYWQDARIAKNSNSRWLAFSETGRCSGRRSYAYYFEENDHTYSSCTYPSVEDHREAQVRDWRIRSADFNIMYYNPAITYTPWVGFPEAGFTAARADPQPGSDGYLALRDLTNFQYEVFTDDHGFVGNLPRGPGSASDIPNGQVDLFDSHVSYSVGSSVLSRIEFIVPNRAAIRIINIDCTLASAQLPVPYANCFGTSSESTTIRATATDQYGRTLGEIKQNVANWYQYHRRRAFTVKAAIARVISTSPGFRFGLSVINETNKLFIELPPAVKTEYSSHNAALLTALFDFDWPALGTPLRRGLERVGKYMDDGLGLADPVVSACQQNFAILFTDGYWNGNDPNSAIGDSDGDGISLTLADVADYYYHKDLSSFPNQVPTSVLDENNIQHMVTMGVAFGVKGDLIDTNNDHQPDPQLAGNGNWGNPFRADSGKIDDVWHAAFNSSGIFMAAQNPAELVESIADALAGIADRVGSSASLATNSASVNSSSNLFQSRFDSAHWSGQLLSFTINIDGTVEPTPNWEAGSVLDGQNYNSQRTIMTFSPGVKLVPGSALKGKGIAFKWPSDYTRPNPLTDLTPRQITLLLTNASFPPSTSERAEIISNQAFGQAITDFLRGQTIHEGAGYGFRDRPTVLGDMVNSTPRFVGSPDFGYPDSLETKPYSDFVRSFSEREGIVYVGANDGMLHGFAQSTGAERLAYIPNAVYTNLPQLARPGYMHHYFVDAGPNIVDAYFANRGDPASLNHGLWRTVLVGGLGAGGQSIYALDVTDPTRFSEANAAAIVLWEFGDWEDADLGFTFGRPQIAKMQNGSWVAIFGNGYNNTRADDHVSVSGEAYLYIVDIETGELIAKLATQSGSAATPNGLATPVLVDLNSDSLVDTIYAGDLLGQLWKFDVSDSSAKQWDVAYTSGNTPIPLFTTEPGQAITTQPQVASHPDNLDGVMIYFGTGKYLEAGDNKATGQKLQAFYGIWDKNSSRLSAFDSSDLLLQTIDDQYIRRFKAANNEVPDVDTTLRDTSDHDIDFTSHMGWKINLMSHAIDAVFNSDNYGERQVSNALLRDGRIIFTTLIPARQACEFGGTSFIMQLDYRDGGRSAVPAFDSNHDGLFNLQDTQASGRGSTAGILSTISILSGSQSNIAFGSGSSGQIETIVINSGNSAQGRQSWRQLD